MATTIPIQPKDEDPNYLPADPTGNIVWNKAQPHVWVMNLHPVNDLQVTITAQHKCNLGVLHDAVYTIPSGQQFPIGPFRHDIYSRADGYAEIGFSFTKDGSGNDVVKVAAQRLC